MVKTAETKSKVRRVKPIVAVPPVGEPNPGNVPDDANAEMNAYAARVREMQSSSMGKEESRKCIIAALEGQGYTNFDGLIIPA